MNKKRLFISCMLLLFLGGCNWVYDMDLSPNKTMEGVNEGNSNVPPFSFTDHNGDSYGSEDLEGHYWIANMIFTNCPSVCPIMTPNMVRLQHSTEEENLDVLFVSFTVDPVVDDTERLRKYGENVGANLEDWRFLTNYSQDEIAEFSREAFVSPVEKVEGSQDILHSTRFFLVDPEGQVIRLYDGLMIDQENIMDDLKTTINKGI